MPVAAMASSGLFTSPRDMNRSQVTSGAGLDQNYRTGTDLTPWESDPYAAYRYGAGAGGSTTAAPTGWDMTSPGVGEQYEQIWNPFFNGQTRAGNAWDTGLEDAFNQSSYAADNWNAVRGQLEPQSAAEEAYNAFNKSTPATMDPYFDRARMKTSASLSDAGAARGAYGASASQGVMGNAMADLGAEQAMAEAQYGLNRADMSGRLAAGADSGKLGRLDMGGRLSTAADYGEMERLTSYLSALTGMDAAELQKVMAGFDMSAGAQQMRRDRGRDMQADTQAMSEFMTQMALAQQLGALAADQSLMDSSIATSLGIGSEQQAQDYQKQAQHREDIQQLIETIGSIKGGGGGNGGPKGTAGTGGKK